MLIDLSNSLDATIDILQTTLLLTPLKEGLNVLPDEVLAMIFQLVGDGETLSLVCHRFRRIASNIPQLWNSISNEITNKDHVHRCLAKSGTTCLDISLHIGFSNDLLDPLVFLDIVLTHSTRWNSLEIAVDFYAWEMQRTFFLI